MRMNPEFVILCADDQEQISSNICNKFEMQLTSPEMNLCTQFEDIYDDSKDKKEEKKQEMFFIAKGTMSVEVLDKINGNKEIQKVRVLDDGDHFGEIALLYDCRRTATVVSENYCTCAKLSKQNLQVLSRQHPKLLSEFKNYVSKTYDDYLLLFLELHMNKVPFFKDMNQQTKKEVLFNMKMQTYQKDSMLYTLNQKSTELWIIQSGTVEIYHYIENDQVFSIENLERGSIICHNSFLLEDEQDTYAKCVSTVTVYALNIEDLNKIRKNNNELDQSIKETEQKILD